MNLQWVDNIFPRNIEEILVNFQLEDYEPDMVNDGEDMEIETLS